MRSPLQQALGKVSPYISIVTLWEHDTHHTDIRKDCCGFDDENPEDWQAWQSEVRASCIVDGEEISGSDYLGGTWERAGDLPEESNPDISGYEIGMTCKALENLAGQVPESDELLHGQIQGALSFTRAWKGGN